MQNGDNFVGVPNSERLADLLKRASDEIERLEQVTVVVDGVAPEDGWDLRVKNPKVAKASCDHPGHRELHACPYESDINDSTDSEYCDCCDACEQECADDI